MSTRRVELVSLVAVVVVVVVIVFVFQVGLEFEFEEDFQQLLRQLQEVFCQKLFLLEMKR